jgi:lipid A disaccharide synthetase
MFLSNDKKAFCAYSMPQIIADSLTIICATTFSSSLPNIIAGEYLVPELIQNDANPDNIAQQAIAILQSDTTALIQAFNNIHQQLNLNASEKSARIIMDFIHE